MLNPLDLETQLFRHAEAIAKVERHGWMTPPTARGRRLGRSRDRVAMLLFALAARVDPESVPAHLRSEASQSRL